MRDVKKALESLTGVPAKKILILRGDSTVGKMDLQHTSWVLLRAKLEEAAHGDGDTLGEACTEVFAFCFSSGCLFSSWDPSAPEKQFRTSMGPRN